MKDNQAKIHNLDFFYRILFIFMPQKSEKIRLGIIELLFDLFERKRPHMGKLQEKLTIVGIFPPPIGGVSIHIERLIPYLEKENLDYLVYNHGRSSDDKVIPLNYSNLWHLKFLFKKQFGLVHFHIAFRGLEFIYWFMYSRFNSKNIIITLHNDFVLKNKFITKYSVFFLKRTMYRELIVVSDKVHSFLNEQNIKNRYLPAYVPPNDIRKTSLETNTVLFAIYRVTKNNLINVYGFDLVMRLLREVSGKYRMFILIGNKDESDVKYLEELIHEYDNEAKIDLVFNERVTTYLPQVDFLLRPNRRDGYGVSLQEAMEFGVIPIASDVCKRPKGTITFRNESFEDFYKKFKYLDGLNKNEREQLILSKENLSFHEQLISIYRKYLH